MFVVIAGGGRTGAQLAHYLINENHKVHIIENRKEVLSRIHKELPTEIIFEGNPLDPTVLEKTGIRDAQVFAATLTTDEANLTLCFYVRQIFHTPRTIARVNNPRNAWLFDEKFDVDVAVNQADILSRLIQEEMSLGDMMTLLRLRKGRYSLVEEKIPPNAVAIGKAIKDISLPENCVISAIIRSGEVVVPRGITKFEEGDEVLAVTDSDGARELSILFSPASKG